MPQWTGIISLVVGFGRPAGARFLVYSVDALLWVLGVALIVATARLWAFFELRHRSRQAAAELSTRMEPRYDDGVSIVDGSATVIGDTRPYRLYTDRRRGPERGRTPQECVLGGESRHYESPLATALSFKAKRRLDAKLN